MRKTSVFIIITIILSLVFSVTAYADMGPKPSVVVRFQSLGDEECWGTLLSKKESTGPATVWDGTEENARHKQNEYYSYSDLDYEIWKAFAEYQDPDGFYFLQEGWNVGDTSQISWTYYPPQTFKILLYFPESGTFISSGICERYAFDSYFNVDMSLTDLSSLSNSEGHVTEAPVTDPPESDGETTSSIPDDNSDSITDKPDEITLNVGQLEPEKLTVEKDYDFSLEILSLVCRILITLAIEILIALIFGYTGRKQILFIVSVNAVTQVILNLLLNVINYKSGELAFVLNYILFEIIVFAIESVIYFNFMQKYTHKRIRRGVTVLYAFVANAVSFFGGLMISHLIPGIF